MHARVRKPGRIYGACPPDSPGGRKTPGTEGFRGVVVEQGTGIEPASTAWEAVVLPMY